MTEQDNRPFVITTYSESKSFEVTVRDGSGREMSVKVKMEGARPICNCVFETEVVGTHAFDEDGEYTAWDGLMLVDDAVKKTGRKYLDRDACDHACDRLHHYARELLAQ